MNISDDLRIEIQCFIYFLFKGTLSSELIFSDVDYLKYLLDDPDFLYSCFENFAFIQNENTTEDPSKNIGIYILNKIQNKPTIDFKIDHLNDFWKDFLILSKRFCYNNFPIKINNFDIKDLNGCGTDAVPYFAVWTNIVEIDKDLTVLNSEYALNRAYERLRGLDGVMPSKDFEDWEMVQELY